MHALHVAAISAISSVATAQSCFDIFDGFGGGSNNVPAGWSTPNADPADSVVEAVGVVELRPGTTGSLQMLTDASYQLLPPSGVVRLIVEVVDASPDQFPAFGFQPAFSDLQLVFFYNASTGEVFLNANDTPPFDGVGDRVALGTMPGFTGGPVRFEFVANASGFELSANVGAYSTGPMAWSSVPDGFDPAGLGSSPRLLIQAFTNDASAAAAGASFLTVDSVQLNCPPCNPADLAPPVGVLDLADTDAFIAAFLSQDPLADLAPPAGVIDLDDTDAFIASFLGGCP